MTIYFYEITKYIGPSGRLNQPTVEKMYNQADVEPANGLKKCITKRTLDQPTD